MINEQIINQLAEKEGVAPTEEQINQRIALETKLSDLRGNRSAPLDRRVVGQRLSEFNVRTKDTLRSVSDADVKKAYDTAIKVPNSIFTRPEQIMTSVIVAKDKAKIDKAYQSLRQGTEFGIVAMQMSELPNAKQSRGQLNWVSSNERGFPKTVTDKVFATQVGRYCVPFQVPLAMSAGAKAVPMWAIIRADQKRPPKVLKLDEVKDYIREQIALSKSNQRDFMEKMLTYQKNANIVVNAERFKDIPELLKKDAVNGLKTMAEQKSGGATIPASVSK